MSERKIRAAIIDQFLRVFNCPPVKDWKKIMKYVRRNLKLCSNKHNEKIKRTFQSVVMQLTRCDTISPDRKKRGITQKNMIDANSFDAQLIADMIESGYSYQKSTIALNMKKHEMNLPFVTFSAVYGVANRLDPVRRTVKKRKQGSFNPDDKWSRARKGWTKQLLVRLGKLKLKSEDGEELKPCYDITKMTTINLPQVVFWDETHAKVQIGCTADYTTSFKRNKDGVLDKEGEYAKDKEILNTKYTDEIRLCVGVAKCLMPNGDTVGMRAETFDYSGKVILSMKDYLARRQREIQRVKDLPVGANWVDNKREKKLYSNDMVGKLKGLRQETLGILHEQEIFTIEDLLSNNEDINGISEKLMRSLMT